MCLAVLEIVTLGEQPPEAVREHLLIRRELEIHARYNPSTVLARMLRWISLEPPTMETCRAQ
jgi:hypothetical protein